MIFHTIHTKKHHDCNFNTRKTIQEQIIQNYEISQLKQTFALIFLVKTR